MVTDSDVSPISGSSSRQVKHKQRGKIRVRKLDENTDLKHTGERMGQAFWQSGMHHTQPQVSCKLQCAALCASFQAQLVALPVVPR